MRTTTVIFLLWAGLPLVGRAQSGLPTITRFAASPAKVLPGQPSTLSWSVIGATSLTLGSGSGAGAVAGTPVDGSSAIVTPATTTSYTLTASNDTGSITASVTVLAGRPPSIAFLTAIPAKVATGQSSTLSWAVTGYPSLTVSPGVGVVVGTSVKVAPSTTQSYILTATNSFGTSMASVTVTAGRAPTITKFVATPVTVTAGQASTLSWAVTGSPSLVMSPFVGTLSGSSAKVTPQATQVYALTATNTFGSVTAAVSVTVIPGSVPGIGSFTATPAKVSPGQSSVLSWAVTGSTGLSVKPGVGAVTGMSVKVTPSTTTTYTLTATNSFGSVTTTVSVMVGSLPTIIGFTATPTKLTLGYFTTLSWAVTGSPTLILNPGFGPVTGTSVTLSPAKTTTYVLTATNSFGTSSATATVTVVPISPPLITAFFANPATVGPGIKTTLFWAVTGATSVSIDHGVGMVTGTSAIVSPTAATTYTLIASNGAGRVSATATVGYMPLTTITSQLYYSEHAMFIVPPASQVTWTGPNSWGSVYSTANVNSYVSTLKGVFPGDYAFVVVTANNLLPNNVPNVQPLRRTADGIGLGSTGVGVPSICNYNIGGGTVIDGAYGVLDHEIGHNWGVFLYPELSNANGHWYANSTAVGQMAEVYSDDGYATIKQISFDPLNGFTWTAVDNITKNETETFSDHDLYLQGLNATFPDMYVVDTPVYNPDQTVSGNSFIKYDQAWLVAKYGVRNPSYLTSPKRLRTGFLYIARDLAEVQAVYQPIERSINHFVNAEQIDTTKFRFQVPFLVDTQYRASLDALLADLDGNKTPTLRIPGPSSLVSSDGTAVVPFLAGDADGPVPAVSCVPASANCAIQGWNVVLTGMASGTHFFTIKAQDFVGKKVFAHFVVDVQ
jgi:hypothetical protein